MTPARSETFGELLRLYRREAGLTQEELATRANISARGISDLERGSRQRPYRDTLLLLAKALQLSGERLAEFERAARSTALPGDQPSETGPRHNLPLEASSFIGRVEQLEQVRGLLRELPVRLVTLTGPGGSGKTRLALQVAASLLDDFPDGVYFVNLAPLRDPAQALSAVAQALGVKEAANMSLLDALRGYFESRRLLLLLDNFEQIIDAADSVAALLNSSPGLKILVTSRIRLHLQGEHEYQAPPLALPADYNSLAQLSQSEAVRLFVARARAIRSDFRLTTENASAVAAITRRLDGLPLAIELAAARVKVLPPEALLARLTGAIGTRLSVLTGGARDLPSRQQTLRGAIEWSYDLLEPDEERLFRQLAVFVGGRTIEAVAAVCHDDGGESAASEIEALDGISSLLDKSLLRQDEGVAGEPRFTMLETIQEYAAEKLAASGELAALRRQHALYFMQMAELAAPELAGQSATWLDRIEADHDNIRAALRWAREQPGATGVTEELPAQVIGLRLAGALWLFWSLRGHGAEGREQLQRLLDLPLIRAVGVDAPTSGADVRSYKAQALTGAGQIAWRQGAAAGAQALLAEGLGLWRAVGAKAGLAQALHGLGIMNHEKGDLIRAREFYSESVQLRREIGDKRGAASTLGNLGNVAWRLEDYEGSRALLEESLAMRRELDDRMGIALALNALGVIAHNQHDFVTARARYAESLMLFREVGVKQFVAALLGNLGNLAQEEGDLAGASALHAESLALRRAASDTQGVATTLGNMASLAVDQRDFAAARRLYAESLTLRRNLTDKLGTILAVSGIGGLTIRAATSGDRIQREKLEGGVRLLGMVAAQLDAMSAVLDSDDLIPHQRSVAVARAELGDDAFEQILTAGRTLSLEQAIELALGYTAG